MTKMAGFWDHVGTAKGRPLGPRAPRIPGADPLTLRKRKGLSTHTLYDTTSILRFITRRFDLPGLWPALRAPRRGIRCAEQPAARRPERARSTYRRDQFNCGGAAAAGLRPPGAATCRPGRCRTYCSSAAAAGAHVCRDDDAAYRASCHSSARSGASISIVSDHRQRPFRGFASAEGRGLEIVFADGAAQSAVGGPPCNVSGRSSLSWPGCGLEQLAQFCRTTDFGRHWNGSMMTRSGPSDSRNEKMAGEGEPGDVPALARARHVCRGSRAPTGRPLRRSIPALIRLAFCRSS